MGLDIAIRAVGKVSKRTSTLWQEKPEMLSSRPALDLQAVQNQFLQMEVSVLVLILVVLSWHIWS